MRIRIKIGLTVCAMMCTSIVWGQFSISKIDPSAMQTLEPGAIIRKSDIHNEFFNESLWRAERRAIRKERNTVEFNANLQLTQTQFENWAAGGNNMFAGRSTLFFRHQHKRDRFALDYRAEARFGFNRIEQKLFKNEDEFKINVLSTWKIRNSWSYAASGNLRSQFAVGYKSRTELIKKSTFMSPGFIDVQVGFNYRREKSPLSITISPVAGNIVVVLDDTLSKQGINGVEKGRHTKSHLGPSLRIDFDKEFAKKVCRYRSSFYTFTNLNTAATARWENTFEIRPLSFLTTTFYWLLYYDRLATTPKPQKLQVTYSLSLGLSYRFKNK